MLVSDFHYDLPAELIAQHPPATRGASRMLLLDRRSGGFADHVFAELPRLLEPGDLLVLNDSRVLPARLYATRAGKSTQRSSPAPSGVVEVLLTEEVAMTAGHSEWRALVRPAKKVQVGETIHFAAAPGGLPLLTAEVVSAAQFGERTLRFAPAADFLAVVERIGHMPLPPYIRRAKHQADSTEDRERYQTVYAHQAGSAAAPTAGLHFTPEVLGALAAHGVETVHITLHVGLGTFQPVRATDTRDIRLHAEPYTLSAATADALNGAYRAKRRILAVGTTTTRTLEHLARTFEAARGRLSDANPLALEAHSGSTNLFLSPPPDGDGEFKLVNGLLTNFHLPQSTLLMLVSAFAGRENALRSYAHAVAQRYRFFSYGDCMLIV
jgi:S-adenosylmethionine:tRNA ribosyltransferase-isomerase